MSWLQVKRYENMPGFLNPVLVESRCLIDVYEYLNNFSASITGILAHLGQKL